MHLIHNIKIDQLIVWLELIPLSLNIRELIIVWSEPTQPLLSIRELMAYCYIWSIKRYQLAFPKTHGFNQYGLLFKSFNPLGTNDDDNQFRCQ